MEEALIETIIKLSSFRTMAWTFVGLALICMFLGPMVSKKNWERIDRIYYLVALFGALLALWAAEPTRKPALLEAMKSLSSEVADVAVPANPKLKMTILELEDSIGQHFEEMYGQLSNGCEKQIFTSCEMLEEFHKFEDRRRERSGWNYASSDVKNGEFFRLLYSDKDDPYHVKHQYHFACWGYWEVMDLFQAVVNQQVFDRYRDKVREFPIYNQTRRNEHTFVWDNEHGYAHGFEFCETFPNEWSQFTFAIEVFEKLDSSIEQNHFQNDNHTVARVSYAKYLALLELLGWYFFLILVCLKIGKASANIAKEKSS